MRQATTTRRSFWSRRPQACLRQFALSPSGLFVRGRAFSTRGSRKNALVLGRGELGEMASDERHRMPRWASQHERKGHMAHGSCGNEWRGKRARVLLLGSAHEVSGLTPLLKGGGLVITH